MVNFINNIKENRKFMLYICVFCIMITSVLQGLSDWDFIWQTYLGKEIVQNGRFNALQDLIWGTKEVSTYIDHEWLTNILFYFLDSVFGTTYGIFMTKFIFSILLSFSLCYFINYLTRNSEITSISFLSVFIIVCIFSITAMKPKAFVLSTIFVTWVLCICEKYTDKMLSFKKFSILTLLILVLWNNFHSGSIVLFFIFYGAYWLFKWREKRVFILGLISLPFLLINPFGLNLILFDIDHFSDKVMKNIIRDWHYLDITMLTGIVILAFVIIVFFHLFNLNIKTDILYIILFLGLFIMTINSMRHFIYLLPVGILIIMKGQFDFDKIKNNHLIMVTYFTSIFAFFLFLFMIYALNNNTNDIVDTYTMNYMSDELENILVEDNKNSCDGLFVPDVNVWTLGLKSFYIGAFPHTRQRSIDGYILMYGDNIQITNIINYYDLNRFLVYNTFESETGYTLNTSLYDYLNENTNYIKLYDDGILSYFVSN